MLLCSACTVAVEPPSATVAPLVVPSSTVAPSSTPLPQASPPVEAPGRYNFLLLGGDYREHRAGSVYGDKTDVMLLVSILMDTPTKITVVQLPRNLYVPVEAMDDQWLFHVYGREGFTGLHYYFQQVFDVDLHGIFYVNMDNFVTLVDGLGGIWISDPSASVYGTLSGDETLAYLRDNQNNWGSATYDRGHRQFGVLWALTEKVKTRFRENALVTAKDLWGAYGGLLTTDLSEFEQIHYLAELAWTIATKEYIVDFHSLSEQAVVRGDTPLEVRGLIPAVDLAHWITEVLDG
jgi:anionic cell wall polymer biosynthesis LytR-Cps2A-Psr (LCP) family protein